MATEEKTVTLSNSQSYPFNNSTQTIALLFLLPLGYYFINRDRELHEDALLAHLFTEETVAPLDPRRRGSGGRDMAPRNH